MLTPTMVALFDAPNNFFLGTSSLLGTLSGALVVRLLYHRTSKTEGRAERFAQVVKGGRAALKAASLLFLVAAALLLGRFGTEVEDGHFWERQALTKRWWVVLRAFAASVSCAAAFMFDAHPLLRTIVLVLQAGMAGVNMVSEIEFAGEIECVTDGFCTASDSHLDSLRMFAVRDLVAVYLGMACFALALWLAQLVGFFSNGAPLARKEHREFMRLGGGGVTPDEVELLGGEWDKGETDGV